MDDLYPDSMSEGSLTGAADDALKLLAYDTVRRDQQRQIYTGRVQDCPALSMCLFFSCRTFFSVGALPCLRQITSPVFFIFIQGNDLSSWLDKGCVFSPQLMNFHFNDFIWGHTEPATDYGNDQRTLSRYFLDETI